MTLREEFIYINVPNFRSNDSDKVDNHQIMGQSVHTFLPLESDNFTKMTGPNVSVILGSGDKYLAAKMFNFGSEHEI